MLVFGLRVEDSLRHICCEINHDQKGVQLGEAFLHLTFSTGWMLCASNRRDFITFLGKFSRIEQAVLFAAKKSVRTCHGPAR